MSAPAVERRYLHGLDGLRAISVLAVLAYHSEASWAPGGFLGVEVFFVVSGYLITGLLLREWATSATINLGRFWARRARRLLPALGALLAGVVAFGAFAAPDARGRILEDLVPSVLYVNNWWQIFSRQSYFAAALRPPLLRHLWSLAVEEQFYVVWPLVTLFAMRWLRSARRFGAMCIVAAVLSAVLMFVLHQPGTDPTREYYGTDTRAGGLLWGAALAALTLHGNFPARKARLFDGVGLASLSALIIMFTTIEDDSSAVYRGCLLLIAAFTAATIVAVSDPTSLLSRWMLGRAPLRWIGTRSYGLYLWHWPIFMVMRPGVDLHGWWVDPLRFALSFVAAEVSFRFVEEPVRRGALGDLLARGGWRRGVGLVTLSSVVLVAGASALPRAATFVPEAPRVSVDLNAALPDIDSGAGLVGGAQANGATGPTISTPPPGATPDVSARPSATVVDVSSDGAGRAPGSRDTAGAARGEVESGAANEGGVLPGAEGSVPGSAQSGNAADQTAPPTSGPGLVFPPITTTTVADEVLGPGETTTTTVVHPVTVSAIGDSVMLFAVPALQHAYGYQISIDAALSRAWDGGLETARNERASGVLGDVVFFHLGANGRIRPGLMSQLTKELADRKLILIFTIRVPRRYEGQVNAELRNLAGRAPNVRIVDWYTYSSGHGEWFQRDGFHLTAAGVVAYVQLLRAALADIVPSPAPSTTTTTTTTTSTTSTTPSVSTTSLPSPTTGLTSTSTSAASTTTRRRAGAVSPTATSPAPVISAQTTTVGPASTAASRNAATTPPSSTAPTPSTTPANPETSGVVETVPAPEASTPPSGP